MYVYPQKHAQKQPMHGQQKLPHLPNNEQDAATRNAAEAEHNHRYTLGWTRREQEYSVKAQARCQIKNTTDHFHTALYFYTREIPREDLMPFIPIQVWKLEVLQ